MTPGKPIRLMVGLAILKSMFGESDEGLVEKWVQNPYWQHLCGEIKFRHEFPIEPMSTGSASRSGVKTRFFRGDYATESAPAELFFHALKVTEVIFKMAWTQRIKPRQPDC